MVQANIRQDVKTGQSLKFRSDNVLYDDYANMSDKEIAELRKKRNDNRSSFSGKMLQTHIPDEYKKKGLHYQWQIDDPINLKKLMEQGWVVVSDETLAKLKGGSTTSVVKIPSGGYNNRGEPEYLVLMAIHQSFYDDDELARKKRIKEINDQIDQGTGIASDKSEDAVSSRGIEVNEVRIE